MSFTKEVIGLWHAVSDSVAEEGPTVITEQLNDFVTHALDSQYLDWMELAGGALIFGTAFGWTAMAHGMVRRVCQ